MGAYFETSELFLLALALSIGVLSSFLFLYRMSDLQVRAEPQWQSIVWPALFVLGIAVMQLLIQLVSDSPVELNVGQLASYLIAVLLVKAGLLLTRGQPSALLSWLILSLMLALAQLVLQYWPLLSSLSRGFTLHAGLAAGALAIQWAGSMLAFYLHERCKDDSPLPGALLLGVSAMAMQLISIEALAIEYGQVMTADLLSEHLKVLAGGIGVATMLILSVCLLVYLTRRQLGQVDEQYRLLVESSLDMIAIVQKGRWVYINRSGLKLLEAEQASELLGAEVWPSLHSRHHHELSEQLDRGCPEPSAVPFEQEWISLKGNVLHTEVIFNPIRTGGQSATQLIVRDITERKKNEELLINSEKLYVAGQLAAGIAHEIRNPLTSLKGFMQLISTGRGDPRRYKDIMHNELTRIESIVSELLMLSKPQLAELSYCDARQALQESLALLAPQANLYQIRMEVDYGETPLWLRGVENQIKQVFINVLKNAIEAMPAGGSIRIRSLKTPTHVHIRIEDEGPGLTEEQLARLGQPFYTTKDRGTGLGLMVSFKIIDNHKGSIALSSKPGQGTICDIGLPYAAEGEEGSSRFKPDQD